MIATNIAIQTNGPHLGTRRFTLDDAEPADLLKLSHLVGAPLAEHDAVAALLG